METTDRLKANTKNLKAAARTFAVLPRLQGILNHGTIMVGLPVFRRSFGVNIGTVVNDRRAAHRPRGVL